MIKELFKTFQLNAIHKTHNINGIDWKYILRGDHSETILILTGGGSIAESAFVYIEEFSKDFRVITVDIPEIYKLSDCVEAINKIIEIEGIQKINMLGFSMGGMIAQAFVRKYPEKIKKLVLFVSMLPSKEYAKKYLKYKKIISFVPEVIFKALSKMSLRKQVLSDKGNVDESIVKFWLDFFNWEFDSGKMNKKKLLASTDILIDYFNNYDFKSNDLVDWEGKVLIIESDKDKTITEVERERFKRTYPNAELVIQKGSGHFGQGLLNPYDSINKIKVFFIHQN